MRSAAESWLAEPCLIRVAGTSTPQPVVGSLKPAHATSTPVTALSATRRGSKTKATQEPLPAYIKDEIRRPEHALLLPFLVRIR